MPLVVLLLSAAATRVVRAEARKMEGRMMCGCRCRCFGKVGEVERECGSELTEIMTRRIASTQSDKFQGNDGFFKSSSRMKVGLLQPCVRPSDSCCS
jgi:hypothetical protein